MRTFGELVYDYEAHTWVIHSLEPHACIKLKSLFPRIPRWQVAPFVFEDKPEICTDLDWFCQRYPLKCDVYSKLLAQKDCYLLKQAEMERLLRPEYVPVARKIKGELRHYQAQAVDLYLATKHLLIGDEIGLGKTVDAIGSFMDPRTLPAAVVVQTHLPAQWADKIREFSDLRIHIIKTRKPYQLPPADVYIFKYSNISGWIDTFQMKIFKSVVYDEVQELRREDSEKYRSAAALSASCEYVMGLTATPIYNYGDEIYNLLHVMKKGCLGDKTDFMREWGCGTYDRKIANPVALGTYLRENYLFLRRTRKEVGRELPQINTIVHTVEVDESKLKSVEELARTLAVRTTTGSFVERGQAARDLDMLVRHATGVSKAKGVADYVKMLLESGEPVLLAGWHRDVYDIWLKELAEYKPAMYTGTESPTQKEQSKDDFLSGKTNLMIISLRSGAGLDGLQARCSIGVIGELDWSPMIHKQLIGRLDREGQLNRVTAIYLVSDTGSDPPIIDLLGLKASQAHEIVDPLAPVEAQHSDESRIQRLAQQYLNLKGAHAKETQEVVEEVVEKSESTQDLLWPSTSAFGQGTKDDQLQTGPSNETKET